MPRPILHFCTVGFSLLGNLSLQAEESGVFYGLELISSFRHVHDFRNLKLSDYSWDIQAATEIHLTNDFSASFGAYQILGDHSFRESSAFLDLRYYLNESLIVGASTSLREVDSYILRDGVELGIFIEKQWSTQWKSRVHAWNDFAIQGTFVSADLEFFSKYPNNWEWKASAGLSAADDYYDRQGLNDVHARLEVSHRMNANWSFSPFVSVSQGLGSHSPTLASFGCYLEFLF